MSAPDRSAVEYEHGFADVASLTPYARNSRTHSLGQIRSLAAAIRRFGFTNPVLVDEEGGIIAGHGRVLAAELIPLAKVPFIRVAGLSEDERRALVIADNQLALGAGWDKSLLSQELGSLATAGFDMGLLGFKAADLQTLLPRGVREGLTHPDDVPATERELVSRPGDVWTMGAHRLVCGDATQPETWTALMQGELAHCCWTDPPYNVAYEGAAGRIQNDSMSDARFRGFLEALFGQVFSVLAKGAPIYVAHADTEGLNFRAAFRAAGFKLSGCLVWQKDALVLGRSDYQWIHEPILYGWKPGAAHPWFGGRKQTTVAEAGEGGPISRSEDGKSWLIRAGDSVLVVDGKAKLRELPTSVVFHERPRRSEDHPTMKPVSLISRQLRNSSKAGELVVDCCAGSGSTLIAAHQLDMGARIVELEPKFADVIVRRWQAHTGLQAVRADGLSFDAAPRRACQDQSQPLPA